MKKLKLYFLNLMLSIVFVIILHYILKLFFGFEDITSGHTGAMGAAVFIFINKFQFSKIVSKKNKEENSNK